MEDSRKKTYIADIERGVYDIKDEMHHKFTTGKGLTAVSYTHLTLPTNSLV